MCPGRSSAVGGSNRVSDEKSYSAACERNREPILGVLREAFRDSREVLEIGSGTGQHAVHFAAHLPHLRWQTSDRTDNLPGIRAWLADASLPNTPAPLELDVAQDDWPTHVYDAVFSANTLHIMSWAEVELLFAGIAGCLQAGGVLAIYGPFNIDGRFTSDSNEAFDRALRAVAPHRGIRDAAAVDALAASHGLALIADHAMPANNRCRVWRRVAA
jgi:cyclopropane fatty-acyl-phospholipid synthase-like methyltransferase